MKRKFMDKLYVHVKAGTGGNGLPKYMGIGGNGGNVWVSANSKQTLRRLKASNPSQRFTATVGEHSRKFCVQAPAGEDCVIEVPPGVQVVTADGTSIGECNMEEERVLIARGGAGGSSSNGFIGQPGDTASLHLVLKLIADIGLIGFPNAGKSTLLRAISNAKPRVASYPFTTLEPTLGLVEFADERRITVADLPGLIEGASRNVGLGHSFLRHVERTKLLLFVVDVGGFQLRPEDPLRSAIETVAILNREIELYKPELLDKPAVLFVNKMDVSDSTEQWRQLRDALRTPESAATAAAVQPDLRPDRWIRFDHVLSGSARTDAESVEMLKLRLRGSMDVHCEDGQETAGLDEIRRRIQAGAYVPLEGRVVDVHDGWRYRRQKQQPLVPAMT